MKDQFENEDDRIQDKFKQKTWNEIRTNDSWAIFKIMSEFVNGYEAMGRMGPCVSIFGSARTKPEDSRIWCHYRRWSRNYGSRK